MNLEKVFLDAKQFVEEAGLLIEQSFQTILQVESKSHRNDLVTNMDKEVERFLIKRIKENYPDHRILGEEGFGNKIDHLNGVVWIIDPIDGTMNFVHQQRNFAISVGVYENGIGKIGLIYDVVPQELYYAIKGEGAFLQGKKLDPLKEVSVEDAIIGINATWVTDNQRLDPSILGALVKDVRGTRSYGSAAIEMAYVAAGKLDAYLTLRLSPWDFAAGLILLEEVGGVATTIKGEQIRLLDQNSIFVSKPGLHEQIFQKYILSHLNDIR